MGAKNNYTTKIRLVLFFTREENDLMKFIFNYKKEGNNLIADGWPSYNFLDSPNVNYSHKVHVHGRNGLYGLGIYSTSAIKGLWGTLRNNITKIYNSIPSKDFILYLR